MNFEDLKQALKVFGFTERTNPTMAQVKRRHRELVKAAHPDLGSSADDSVIRTINAASKTILEYLNNYHYSFTEEEFYRQNPEAHIFNQFASDPSCWGGGTPR